MACEIVVTRVEGIRIRDGAAQGVRITGTAQECPALRAMAGEIDSSGVVAGIPLFGATIVSGETWTIDALPVFSNARRIACGSRVAVYVECVGVTPLCRAQQVFILECPPPAECPQIGRLWHDEGPCDGLRRRLVTLHAEVTPVGSGPVNAHWDFGDGTSDGIRLIMPGAMGVVTSDPHPYSSDDEHTAFLVIDWPPGCVELPITYTFRPAPCPDVIVDCSVLTLTPVTVPDGSCAGGSTTFTTRFTANLSPPRPDAIYVWQITPEGDTDAPLMDPRSANFLDHEFEAPGNYSISVSADWPGRRLGCVATDSQPLPIPSCCPAFLDPEDFPPSLTKRCRDGDSVERVEITVHTDPPNASGTYQWLIAGGTPNAATTTGPTSPEITFSSPGHKAIVVSLVTPGCDETKTEFDVEVEACGPSSSGPSSSLCGTLVWIIGGLAAAAMAVTVLTLIWELCRPPGPPTWVWGVVAGLWIAVGLAIWLSYFLCNLPGLNCPCLTKCDYLQIITMAAAAGAAVASVISTCCGAWWLVNLVFICLFVIAFLWWTLECRPSFCIIVVALTVAIGSAALPAITWLLLTPLGACYSGIIFAIWGGALAGLIVITAGCAVPSR